MTRKKKVLSQEWSAESLQRSKVPLKKSNSLSKFPWSKFTTRRSEICLILRKITLRFTKIKTKVFMLRIWPKVMSAEKMKYFPYWKSEMKIDQLEALIWISSHLDLIVFLFLRSSRRILLISLPERVRFILLIWLVPRELQRPVLKDKLLMKPKILTKVSHVWVKLLMRWPMENLRIFLIEILSSPEFSKRVSVVTLEQVWS